MKFEAPKKVTIYHMLVFLVFLVTLIISNIMNTTENYWGQVVYNTMLVLGGYLLYVIFTLISPKSRLFALLMGLGGLSFFVYCSHVFFIHPYHEIIKSMIGISSLTYFLVFILVTASSLAIGTLLHKFVPSVFSIMTGHRK